MGSINRPIFQVVCVVWSLDETLENWKALVDFRQESIKYAYQPQARCLYRGQEAACPIRSARFDLGGVELKLVEPMNKQGGDPYSDSLLAHGQGFHHLGICAGDQPTLLERWSEKGLRPLAVGLDEEAGHPLFDLTRSAGFAAALWDHMTGPCGPRDSLGRTV